jgi:hypothetical protein
MPSGGIAMVEGGFTTPVEVREMKRTMHGYSGTRRMVLLLNVHCQQRMSIFTTQYPVE